MRRFLLNNVSKLVSPLSTKTFEIHFFNVGEGDSALVECDGHYMLIDGGNPSSVFLCRLRILIYDH